ncbi:hypothetical protein [Glutamicibacter sp. FBE19]|uniref:hypothetical protein n=1 Tax=Glutamicibacter sp. FBE19 TaxID=2761534 RepID=UPI00189692BC|nr:hypothetical protein [Glutamicibacter sp. FBE19]MBF6670313.1 hypothetical protein [Glutamicibacter sp. FBE19]
MIDAFHGSRVLAGVLPTLCGRGNQSLFGLGEFFNASFGPKNWFLGAVGYLVPTAGRASPDHLAHGHLDILPQASVVAAFVVPSLQLALIIDVSTGFGFDQGVSITPWATDRLVHDWSSVASWPLLLRGSQA